MASVEIQGLQKMYGDVQVLHDINLSIADREFLIFVGPSGCGKSTLLRMIAGLEAASGGDIRIDGRLVNNLPAKERDIAMVFQNYALYPHMTVFNNMAFSLKLKGAPGDEIARRVNEAASILNLGPYLARRPSQLSGGQRQRVAMGRAIVRDPKVFLFDEPLSNLDAKLRVQMRTEIKALHKRLQSTIVYVTHDQVEAMTMADRIVVMNKGRIEQIGRPLDIYDQPNNLFVAGFIGSPAMNALPGRIHRNGAKVVIRVGELEVPLDRPVDAEDGKDVVCGVRPEHISVAHGGDGVGGRVDVVEPTGSQTFVNLELCGQPMLACLGERHPIAVGEVVPWRIESSRVLVFDNVTGARL